MSGRIYWLTATARKHLKSVIADTHRRWGGVKAKSYRDALLKGCQAIANNPSRLNSPHRKKLAADTFFEIRLVEHHYVAFKAVENGIIVASFIHEKMDVPHSLRELEKLSSHEIAAMEAGMGSDASSDQ